MIKQKVRCELCKIKNIDQRFKKVIFQCKKLRLKLIIIFFLMIIVIVILVIIVVAIAAPVATPAVQTKPLSRILQHLARQSIRP